MSFWFKKKEQPLSQQNSPVEDAQRHAHATHTYKKGKNTVIYLSREDEEALRRAEDYLEELRHEREREHEQPAERIDAQSGWGPGTLDFFATMASTDYSSGKPDNYLVRSTDSSPLYFDNNNSNPASGQASPAILDESWNASPSSSLKLQYASSLALIHTHLETSTGSFKHHDESPPLWGSSKSTSSQSRSSNKSAEEKASFRNLFGFW